MRKYVPLGFGLLGLLILLSLNFEGGGLSARRGGSATGLTHGDANCNGTIDALDALLVLRGSASAAEATDCAADNDCSGAVDSTDALRLLRHSSGLSVSYERGCPLIGGKQQPP